LVESGLVGVEEAYIWVKHLTDLEGPNQCRESLVHVQYAARMLRIWSAVLAQTMGSAFHSSIQPGTDWPIHTVSAYVWSS
jgi:hypothetical protein